MKMRTRMLLATLLAFPALGLTQEQTAAKPAQPTPQVSAKPSFDLKDAGVQEVVRAAAATQDAFAAAPKLEPDKEPADLPFRAPRRPHHIECGAAECVAYTADGDSLYTVPREQYLGVNGDNPREVWLSCQSGNDLLPTSERYAKCRGVAIGLPLEIQGVIVNLPLLRL